MPRIELLYFEECPNYRLALDHLRDLLHAQGLPDAVELVRVEDDEDALRHRFYGSPTIRVDGQDVASPPTGAVPALACRVYRVPDGRMSPWPPDDAIRAALLRPPQGD